MVGIRSVQQAVIRSSPREHQLLIVRWSSGVNHMSSRSRRMEEGGGRRRAIGGRKQERGNRSEGAGGREQERGSRKKASIRSSQVERAIKHAVLRMWCWRRMWRWLAADLLGLARRKLGRRLRRHCRRVRDRRLRCERMVLVRVVAARDGSRLQVPWSSRCVPLGRVRCGCTS